MRLQDLGDGLRAGGKAALSRALTALETRAEAAETLALLDAAWAAPKGVAIGLTGPPGVGKSSLTHALIPHLRATGRSLGIIAVDPSSRRTGGALLGDRARVSHDPADAGVFLRSMAARDRLGGVAEVTFPALVLMRALFDLVIVETVGVGQSEIEVSEMADLTVFCAQPGSGDALQYMKAGVMEVLDLIFVTKGDMTALAQRTAADLRGALSLGTARPPAVQVLSATTGEGMAEAVAVLLDLASGDRAAQRSRQAEVWIDSNIRINFGRFGRDKVVDSIFSGNESPFSHCASLRQKLLSLLETAPITL